MSAIVRVMPAIAIAVKEVAEHVIGTKCGAILGLNNACPLKLRKEFQFVAR